MKLFSEWMNIRSSHESIVQWTWFSDQPTVEGTEAFLKEKGAEFFRDFQLIEVAEKEGQIVALVGGSPAVTLFELEAMKFYPAT